MSKLDSISDALVKLGTTDVILAFIPMTIARFKSAIKQANPQLDDARLTSYEEHFNTKIDHLSEIALARHVTSISDLISDEELDVICEFANHPKIHQFLEVSKKTQSTLFATIQDVMQTDGLLAHNESQEAAFNTM